MQDIKRFYKAATAGPVAEGFAILLDGRAVRTPAKAPLVVPSQALAEAIAAEWQAQDETVQVAGMALNNLTCTAIDIVAPQRRKIVDDLAGYGGHDLLCYWADGEEELLRRQQQAWQPLLDWAAESLSAPLRKTCGVISQDQPPESLEALQRAVEAHDALELTGLSAAVQASGSLVVGLALSLGRLGGAEAHRVAQLDEDYQAERWGEDAEAAARREALRLEMLTAERFLALIRQNATDD